MNGGPSEVDRVRSLREALVATGAGLYLCTHLAGPMPAETIVAVHESDDMELRVGRAGPDRREDLGQREKEARAVAAAAIKASPEHLVLMHGAPEAARLVTLELLTANAAVNARDVRVLILDGMDEAVVAALSSVAVAAGATVEVVDQLPQIIAADVAIVALAHVDQVGNVAELQRVGEAAHNADAHLLVDASLSVGALPVEVASLGADVLIADTRRWLLGPESVTLAWVSPELDADLAESMRGMTGPFGRHALLALARSLGWLLMYIELPWILARTKELSDRLYDDLRSIDGVTVLAREERHGALAAFRLAAWDSAQAVEELSRSVFAILEADTEHDLIRASVGAWNHEDELDRLIDRVRELAVHTPETLPRKPSLTIISGPTLVPDDET